MKKVKDKLLLMEVTDVTIDLTKHFNLAALTIWNQFAKLINAVIGVQPVNEQG